MKVFLALVIVGFLAASYGAIKTYLDNTSQAEDLAERGVVEDANVVSATEVSGRRIETYHKLNVSYDPPGPQFLEFTEVQDCSGARWEPGMETVRVIYLPDDPEVIRIVDCAASFDTNVLPAIAGAAFLGVALLMLWRLRGVWRA